MIKDISSKVIAIAGLGGMGMCVANALGPKTQVYVISNEQPTGYREFTVHDTLNHTQATSRKLPILATGKIVDWLFICTPGQYVAQTIIRAMDAGHINESTSILIAANGLPYWAGQVAAKCNHNNKRLEEIFDPSGISKLIKPTQVISLKSLTPIARPGITEIRVQPYKFLIAGRKGVDLQTETINQLRCLLMSTDHEVLTPVDPLATLAKSMCFTTPLAELTLATGGQTIGQLLEEKRSIILKSTNEVADVFEALFGLQQGDNFKEYIQQRLDDISKTPKHIMAIGTNAIFNGYGYANRKLSSTEYPSTVGYILEAAKIIGVDTPTLDALHIAVLARFPESQFSTTRVLTL